MKFIEICSIIVTSFIIIRVVMMEIIERREQREHDHQKSFSEEVFDRAQKERELDEKLR